MGDSGSGASGFWLTEGFDQKKKAAELSLDLESMTHNSPNIPTNKDALPKHVSKILAAGPGGREGGAARE